MPLPKIQKNKTIPRGTEFSCQREGLTIRGTEYRPQGGTKYHPQDGTKYRPQGGTKYHPQDGTKYRPQFSQDEKLPIAIVCHGFMDSRDGVRRYARAFAEMGYLSYCFDFSGGCVAKGKSDGKTTDMSVLTEVKDLEAVIGYAKSREGVDPAKITLMGCSQGGFVSALAAAKPENRIHRLVMFYPALCIPDDARAGEMLLAKFDPSNIPDIVWCGPMKLGRRYMEDVIGMDSFSEISGFSGDVLIVHGSKDKLVNVSYSERACEAYKEKRTETGGTVTLHIIENAGHGFSKKEDETAIEYIRNFLMQ